MGEAANGDVTLTSPPSCPSPVKWEGIETESRNRQGSLSPLTESRRRWQAFSLRVKGFPRRHLVDRVPTENRKGVSTSTWLPGRIFHHLAAVEEQLAHGPGLARHVALRLDAQPVTHMEEVATLKAEPLPRMALICPTKRPVPPFCQGLRCHPAAGKPGIPWWGCRPKEYFSNSLAVPRASARWTSVASRTRR